MANIELLHKMKISFEEILTEKYIPRAIFNKKDELGCVKLPTGTLRCPVDFIPATNKYGQNVIAMKFPKTKFHYANGALITNKCKAAMRYLILINVQQHLYRRNKMDDGDMSEIEVETRSFIDALSDGCAYFCYRHVLEICNHDIDYQLYSLKVWAESEINKAIKNFYMYKHRLSKDEAMRDMFVKRGESVFTCLEGLNGFRKRERAMISRRLHRIKTLSSIIFAARKKNIHLIYKKVKRGGAKFNTEYLLERLNIKLVKIGMRPVSKRTLYRYIKEILKICGKSVSVLYKEVMIKDGIITTKIKGIVQIGDLYLSYRGTMLKSSITQRYVDENILGEVPIDTGVAV